MRLKYRLYYKANIISNLHLIFLRDGDPHPPWSIPIVVVLPQCYKLSHCMQDNKFQAIALCIIKHAVEWSYPFVTNYSDICATAT